MSETGHGHEQDRQLTQEFVDAMGAVQTYNLQHTGVGHMVTGIISFFNVAEPDGEPSLPPEEEAEIDRDLTTLLQTDRLAAMGVTLYDPASLQPADIEEEKTAGGGQPARLMMLITDGGTFKETLSRLTPTPDQEHDVANGVETLLGSAVRIVQETYPRPDDETGGEELQHVMEKATEEQLDLFVEVSPILTEKGFSNGRAYALLTEYAARQASGTLPEYREAEAQHLLHDQFGPDRWVVDMSPEQLERRWSEAFALLGRMQAGQEPSPFFTELFKKLRADFDAAKSWTETTAPRDDSDPSSIGPPARYLQGVKGAMQLLEPRWQELFPLENAYYLSEKADLEQ